MAIIRLSSASHISRSDGSILIYLSVVNHLREYELFKEAHTYLTFVLNCSCFCHHVYHLQPPPPAAVETPSPRQLFLLPPRTHKRRGSGWVRQQQGWGIADSTQGERIWSSLGRHKVKRGSLIIHFLWIIFMSSKHLSKTSILSLILTTRINFIMSNILQLGSNLKHKMS